MIKSYLGNLIAGIDTYYLELHIPQKYKILVKKQHSKLSEKNLLELEKFQQYQKESPDQLQKVNTNKKSNSNHIDLKELKQATCI